MKLELTFVHIAITAIFNSNIRVAFVKELKQRKNAKNGKFAEKLLEIITTRNGVRESMKDRLKIQPTAWMKMISLKPVIFHNLCGYDGQIIIKHITKDFATEDIEVIPTPLRNSYLSKLVISAS